ncbi:MAG: serine hydrolase [Micromonosporaceae bacterium]
MSASRALLITLLGGSLMMVTPPAAWAGDPAAPPELLGLAAAASRTGPPTVIPDDLKFPRRTLRQGAPQEVGLLPEQIEKMNTAAEAYLQPTPDHSAHPSYAGAVVLGAKDGVIVDHEAFGHAMRYSGTRVEDGTVVGVELPRDEWTPATKDTMFDMASVSKLFTTVIVLQLAERGQLDLNAPVASYIPEFGVNGKSEITLKMLLTHSSGMRAWLPLYSGYDTPEERIAATYASTLQPGTAPGRQYIYSDLGLITLGKLAEKVTGTPLDQLVAERITEPLRMTDTMYNPPESLHHRIAATEEQPWAGRPMIRGEVHDENAWSLDGVAGHAGIFSTAADMAVFSQMLLNGGVYGERRILDEDTVRAALVNYNGHLGTSASQRGLGFELNKHWYMGPLASPVTFGHTGYTGTTVSIDPIAHSFVIFMSNRVHPSRDWGSNNAARLAMTTAFGHATPVRPAAGKTAWRADGLNSKQHTLTAELTRPAQDAQLRFGLWADTETFFDFGKVEVSTDDGQTWSLLPFSHFGRDFKWENPGEFHGYQGRSWSLGLVSLPDGATHVRFSYLTDSNAQGRGMYVDAVHAADESGVLLNSETSSGNRAFTADGWSLADA